MFSLNIVQIRCYVLMKMILKSHENLDSGDALSTFICKTVLLHCIERNGEIFWQDDNLLECLNVCLKFMHDCVLSDHCPHFIIKDNNLMANCISPKIKPQILDKIQHILMSDGRALMEIKIDQLGMRLKEQFQVLPSLEIKYLVSGQLLYSFMMCLSARIRDFLYTLTEFNTQRTVQTLNQYIEELERFRLEGNDFEHDMLSPFIYMSLGSVMASYSISKNTPITQNFLVMLEQGSTNDFSSSLKCASIFFCVGDLNKTLDLLDQIEEQYTLENLQSVCCCYESPDQRAMCKEEFNAISVEGDVKDVLKHTAFCVRYLPREVNCVPEELKHEFFRSELNTRQYRGPHDNWMDWAVVDSIPFFYFLQYIVYRNKGIRERQQTALCNLGRVTRAVYHLGHRETALNLLGQCMEQENRLEDASHSYHLSKELLPVHNAAESLISNLFKNWKVND